MEVNVGDKFEVEIFRYQKYPGVSIYCIYYMLLIYPLLEMLFAKCGWNWSSASGEEDKNVKSSRRQRADSHKYWSEKLTWVFGFNYMYLTNNQFIWKFFIVLHLLKILPYNGPRFFGLVQGLPHAVASDDGQRILSHWP